MRSQRFITIISSLWHHSPAARRAFPSLLMCEGTSPLTVGLTSRRSGPQATGSVEAQVTQSQGAAAAAATAAASGEGNPSAPCPPAATATLAPGSNEAAAGAQNNVNGAGGESQLERERSESGQGHERTAEIAGEGDITYRPTATPRRCLLLVLLLAPRRRLFLPHHSLPPLSRTAGRSCFPRWSR